MNIESYLLFLSNSNDRILINDNLNRSVKFKKLRKIFNNNFYFIGVKCLIMRYYLEIIKNFDSRCMNTI